MRPLFITLALLLACAPALTARTTAPEAFTSAPDGIFMLLSRNDRLDMVDYYRGGMPNATTNRLGGSTRITSLADDAITVQMTPASTYQLVLLPAGNAADDILALIITMAAPAKDSRVQFYRAADWSAIPAAKVMAEPTLDTWLTAEGKARRDMVEAVVPFIMAEYTYTPGGLTLVATNDLETFLSPDMYAVIASCLKPSLTWLWDGSKLRLQK